MSKKIMFNDKYGLTRAVLERRNTQTRRPLTLTLHKKADECNNLIEVHPSKVFFEDGKWKFEYDGYVFLLPKKNYPKYKVGEVVAVAQSYKDIFSSFSQHPNPQLNIGVKNPTDTAGWNNKMFVKPNLMPHHIKINDVKVERLQDISDETSIKEGIRDYSTPNEKRYGYYDFMHEEIVAFRTPREAFASLIDKVSGKGTWESNPYVFVYDFELVD